MGSSRMRLLIPHDLSRFWPVRERAEWADASSNWKIYEWGDSPFSITNHCRSARKSRRMSRVSSQSEITTGENDQMKKNIRMIHSFTFHVFCPFSSLIYSMSKNEDWPTFTSREGPTVHKMSWREPFLHFICEIRPTGAQPNTKVVRQRGRKKEG